MKFFHLSDLHIGRQLGKHSLRDEQRDILAKIIDHAKEEKPDAIVVAGDVFDKSDPPPEAVSIFNEFVSQLHSEMPKTAIMIVGGNHDSSDRIDLYSSILDKQNVHIAGNLPRTLDEKLRRVTLEDEYGPVHFYLLPFVGHNVVIRMSQDSDEEQRLSYEQGVAKLLANEEINPDERNVLVSHQFFVPAGMTADDMEKERTSDEVRKVGNVDAVSARVLEPFTYAALGHIHKPMDIGNNARYCGTPLQYSLSEADQEKSITMVELTDSPSEAEISLIPLKPLRAVRRIKGKLHEVAAQGCNDFVEITLTDENDLDPVEMSSRLNDAFHYLLGYSHVPRDVAALTDLDVPAVPDARTMDPLEMCIDFLGNVTDDERKILVDIIEKVSDADSTKNAR